MTKRSFKLKAETQWIELVINTALASSDVSYDLVGSDEKSDHVYDQIKV